MLGFQLALFVALAAGLRSLRDRARARAEDDYDLRGAEQVFERPWAMALLITALLMVFQSLATFALVLWPLRLLRSISQHRLLVRRRLEQALSVLAVGLWATLVFGQLGLLGPVRAGVGRTLDAAVSIGDSALDFKLRVWSEILDDGFSIRSEIAVAVQEALEQAGIGVPFPQRDLHLVSVSPNAAADLGSATRASPGPIPTSVSSDGN
jgi:hypothetical protein